MKLIAIAFFTLIQSISAFAQSGHHGPHLAKHNMLVIGKEEIHLSHIVYKVPHNYQVILEIRFPAAVKSTYLAAKAAHPGDTFILLLDPFDISDIATQTKLTGTLSRTDAAGNKTLLATGVELLAADFTLTYFNELPLSLE